MKIKRKQIIEFLVSMVIMLMVIAFIVFVYIAFERWQGFMALCGL